MADAERVSIHFQGNGVHYYVAARSAAKAQLMPLTGNLFHHAVEMFLKGGLAKRGRALDELRDLGHSLTRLWTVFKELFADFDLSEFNETISRLDPFERIRYPDAILKEGMSVHLEWEPFKAEFGGEAAQVPLYEVFVTDIDRLIGRLFEATNTNPVFYTNRLNEYAKGAITYRNPGAEFLMTPMSA